MTNPQRQGTLQVYTIGFILSLALTIVPYLVVTHHTFSGKVVVGIIALLAIVQLLVQLVFFLHLDEGERPRLNVIALVFALLIVCILGGGSSWIMNNLNDNGMSAQDLTKYIQDQEAIHK